MSFAPPPAGPPLTAGHDAAGRLASVQALFARSIAVKTRVMEHHAQEIVAIGEACADCLEAGGKILFCGNGGSAADAQHLAAELLVRLRSDLNRPGLAALALAVDSSSMTACANDYSIEIYYQRMVETLGQAGDVLIGITTSGKSPNVVRALRAARAHGLTAIGLLGGDGGPALEDCDLALVVPDTETGRIQESHITAGHAFLHLVEDLLVERGVITPL